MQNSLVLIDAIGKDVTRFKVGDEVFGYRGTSMGANAEYLCMAEDSTIGIKPDNMSFVEAATIPYGMIMALPILRKVNIQPGQKVLVNGASGSIGSYALQLAKHSGAEVTGVCGTPRLEMVKALGADIVIDYTQEDFTTNGETYDVILDILGKTSFAQVKNSLTPNGVLLYASFRMPHLFLMLWTFITGSSKKVICALASEDEEALVLAKNLIESGDIRTVVDRYYPLAQAADAHRYIESGEKTGHVVLTIQDNQGEQA